MNNPIKVYLLLLSASVAMNGDPCQAADFTITDRGLERLSEELELRGLAPAASLGGPLLFSRFRQCPDSVKSLGQFKELSRGVPYNHDQNLGLFSTIESSLEQSRTGHSTIGHFRGGLLMGSGPWSMAGTYDGVSGDDAQDNYYGYRWRGVRARTDQVYLRWSGDRAFCQLGKDYLRYGLGMGLAGNSPVENIQAGIRVGRHIKLHGFTGKLDGWLRDSVFVNRFLAGHRVQLDIGFLQLGLSEFAIYGGPGRTYEPYYLLPLYIFLGEQDNRQIDDNIIWDLDCKVLLPPFAFKAELMVDDFQIERKSRGDEEPTEAGFGIQADWAILSSPLYLSATASYRMVTNWTFNQNKDWNRFIFEGQPIGPREGNDFDLASFKLNALGNRWDAWAEIYYRRRGQGRIDDPWTSPWTTDSTWSQTFPSGLVEKITGFQAGINYLLPGSWFFGSRRQAGVFGQWSYRQAVNQSNLPGIDGKDWVIKLGLGISLSRSLETLAQ
ncbi:hypothetical protein HY768_03280 [candidate division TA06 bacterium]|uniref:Capsule assembly Wzi family protein n=1 Tax=candidate division TA06 bacterium TaxID=2250710 RepID=A0A933I8L9_UNCT6|nr:hypothetical protein [candidate division TA06 bacterium]